VLLPAHIRRRTVDASGAGTDAFTADAPHAADASDATEGTAAK
jgi:hypothetical protein